VVGDVRTAGLVADPQGLDALKAAARQQSPEALREAARQFESLLARMMIRSMREASLGEGLLDSEQGDLYQDMLDQQLSVELTRGRGLGLADLLIRQLSGVGGPGTERRGTADRIEPAGVAPAAGNAAPPPRTPPAMTDARWPPRSREEFVATLWPHAVSAGRELGVAPATIVSHAALETGWGRSLPQRADGATSYNLFGIKATGDRRGGAAAADTVEYERGRAVTRTEHFRAYDSLAAAVRDYAGLIAGSPRYAAALNAGADAGAYAAALQRGGYATDPGYATKLSRVAESVQSVLRGAVLKFAAGAPITPSGRTR
jgi:flagellar protein FlgJ